ncbi:MAG: phosphotransferase [Hyphomicrobiales bacterium]
MSDEAIGQAREAVAKLGLFDGADASEIDIQRLGGLTNMVFHIAHNNNALCLRLPGKGTEEYIDRAVEAHNAKAAARAGVSPDVIHADPETGIMVTTYLDGLVTMTAENFATRAGSPARAAKAFHKLHTSGQTFQFRFELFAMIDEYLNVLSTKSVDFPEGYHDVLKEAEAVRAALDADPAELAPCHCDPLAENFLDDGKRMWIVDWEYSGMNDPLWDLGDTSVEAGFSDAQDEEMMNAYFAGGPSDAQMGRMIIYKAMCDLLWTLWGLIQYANDNPAEDFWAYSTGRFERCKALMGTKEFEAHLRAVRQET